MIPTQPGLFGLCKTNRDFTQKNAWGKNQFNSAFPAALCCYLASKQLEANYLAIQSGSFCHSTLAIEAVFGLSPHDPDLYFAFEAQHTPYQKYVIGSLPRTDLVLQRESTGECLAGLEIKLTALPDQTTCELEESNYGCEIVVRPDTIVYLACSLAGKLTDSIKAEIPTLPISDWSQSRAVLPHISTIVETIETIALAAESTQKSFLLQPIWKTKGKSPQLAEQCLDVFVWSDAGFTFLLSKLANVNAGAMEINRQTRTVIWLFKMLSDLKSYGKFDHRRILDLLSYNTKNDKAFSSSGKVTYPYMACPRLREPIISKQEIKEIILGKGQNLLSPERRFDAIIYNSPELFT